LRRACERCKAVLNAQAFCAENAIDIFMDGWVMRAVQLDTNGTMIEG
jgi:RNA polymerase subunit RPABC4/transcription elongation factor Spt4